MASSQSWKTGSCSGSTETRTIGACRQPLHCARPRRRKRTPRPAQSRASLAAARLRDLRVELGELDALQRILLAIHDLLFQRRVNLGEGHRNGVGAQRVEQIDIDRRLHDTYFQALEILELGDRMLAVGEVAKAEFPIPQR